MNPKPRVYRPRRAQPLLLAFRIALLAGAVAAVVVAATGAGWDLYVVALGLLAGAATPERRVSYRGKNAWERVLIYFGLR